MTDEQSPPPRFAWLDEIQSGAVDPNELRQVSGVRWYPEEVEAAHAKAEERPGYPLVISVHSGHGPATVSRLKRIRQERWKPDRYIIRTRLLGRPGQQDRLAAVTLTFPRRAS